MESKNKSTPFVNIGSSSLLVIFIVLCLVTFATLSLSSAQSDYSFSKKLADRRTDYYTASNQAEEILGSIDEVLSQTYEESPLTYNAVVEKHLSGITFKGKAKDTPLEIDFSLEKPSVAYSVPVNNKQSLSVILELNAPDSSEDGFYRVKQWKVVSMAQWSGDHTLKLIQ